MYVYYKLINYYQLIGIIYKRQQAKIRQDLKKLIIQKTHNDEKIKIMRFRQFSQHKPSIIPKYMGRSKIQLWDPLEQIFHGDFYIFGSKLFLNAKRQHIQKQKIVKWYPFEFLWSLYILMVLQQLNLLSCLHQFHEIIKSNQKSQFWQFLLTQFTYLTIKIAIAHNSPSKKDKIDRFIDLFDYILQNCGYRTQTKNKPQKYMQLKRNGQLDILPSKQLKRVKFERINIRYETYDVFEGHFELKVEQLAYQLKIFSHHNDYLAVMNFTTCFPIQLNYHKPIMPSINIYNLAQSHHCLPYIYQYMPQELYLCFLSNQNIVREQCQNFTFVKPLEKTSFSLQQKTLIAKTQETKQIKLPQTSMPKYAKKNAESNVINQVFSFLSTRSKSGKAIKSMLKENEQLINMYYQLMKQIKRRNKKYINRCYLKDLIELSNTHIAFAIVGRLDPHHRFGVDEFRKIIRTLISYYLKNVCVSTILTSSKLDRQTKNEHLQRKSQIETYLNYHIKYSINNNPIQ